MGKSQFSRVRICIAVIMIALCFMLGFFGKMTHAQTPEGAVDSAVIHKLDQILANQKALMQDMSALKEEVGIIKIRVTQIQ